MYVSLKKFPSQPSGWFPQSLGPLPNAWECDVFCAVTYLFPAAVPSTEF